MTNFFFQSNFCSEKSGQVKLETADDDMNDDETNDDEKSDESEIDENFSVDILKEKQKKNSKLLSAKKCRKKRKNGENVVDDFDVDDDVEEKRQKLQPDSAGPPFECLNCDASHDTFSTHRSVIARNPFLLFCRFSIKYFSINILRICLSQSFKISTVEMYKGVGVGFGDFQPQIFSTKSF